MIWKSKIYLIRFISSVLFVFCFSQFFLNSPHPNTLFLILFSVIYALVIFLSYYFQFNKKNK